MSDADAGAGKVSVEVNVEEFATLVANMSRLLSGFGGLEPLRQAGLSLGEWVALATLARADEGATNKVLGRNLGVAPQRAGEISSSLLRGGLVSIGPSTGKRDQVSLVKLSAAGKAKLDEVNAGLGPILSQALKGRSLLGAKKQMKSLGRLLRMETPEKATKRKEKKAKKADKKKGDEAKG